MFIKLCNFEETTHECPACGFGHSETDKVYYKCRECEEIKECCRMYARTSDPADHAIFSYKMCDLCVEKIIIKDGYVAIPPPRRNENKRENDVQENL